MHVLIALIFFCPLFWFWGFMVGRSRYEPPKDEHFAAMKRALRPIGDWTPHCPCAARGEVPSPECHQFGLCQTLSEAI